MKRKSAVGEKAVRKRAPAPEKPEAKTRITIPRALTVKQFADLLGISVIETIKHLMRAGIMANVNQVIDYDSAAAVAAGLLIVEFHAPERCLSKLIPLAHRAMLLAPKRRGR